MKTIEAGGDVTAGSARRLRVFISYSRADRELADQLVAALTRENLECLIDRRDIPYGEKWRAELELLIRRADAVVFLVSPRSVVSGWCRWELAQVAQLSKRLVPLVIEPVPNEQLPAEIVEIQVLSLEGRALSATMIATLVDAVARDRAWLLQHSTLGERAAEWSVKRSADKLLRGAALREAELWLAQRPDRAPAPSAAHLQYIIAGQLAAQRRKRRQRVGIAVLAVAAVLVASAYLISSALPDIWSRVEQPDNSTEFAPRPFLPVRHVAIHRDDPAAVLYLGRRSDWDSSGFWIVTKRAPDDFVSHVRTALDERKTGPVARIEISIGPASFGDETDELTEVRAKGVVSISAAREIDGTLRFFRTASFEPMAKGAEVTAPNPFPSPRLVQKDDEVFDLGEYAEYLLANDMLISEDDIRGNIHDLTTSNIVSVTYLIDDRIADGETTARYGSEYSVFGTERAPAKLPAGVSIDGKHDGQKVWRAIEDSSDWLRYRAPELRVVGGRVDPTAAELAGNIERPGNLLQLLEGIMSNPDAEGASEEVISTESIVGRTDLMKVEVWDGPQGSGQFPRTLSTDWLLRLGESNPWREFEPPTTDILGVWVLDRTGQHGLLLSLSKGLFRTRDGGASWEIANYNETGLEDGSKVKPIVAGEGHVVALIDRGSSIDGADNPLFRLQHRTSWERWRAGLKQLLD